MYFLLDTDFDLSDMMRWTSKSNNRCYQIFLSIENFAASIQPKTGSEATRLLSLAARLEEVIFTPNKHRTQFPRRRFKMPDDEYKVGAATLSYQSIMQ